MNRFFSHRFIRTAVALLALLLALPSIGLAQTSSLRVQIKGNGTDNNQQTQFAYSVTNTGTSAVSSISVRVYFTLDGTNAASNYTLEKYYDQSGAGTISGPTLASGSTYYYTVTYGTASLGAGATWEFQTSLHLSNWGTTLSSANDHFHTGYAVGALPAAYTATNYIPAYVNGTLVWGQAPGGAVPTNTVVVPTNTQVVPTVATTVPTQIPSITPSRIPPTVATTAVPTRAPTRANTPGGPTATRTRTPTRTRVPTRVPTTVPTTAVPTRVPTTAVPTRVPTTAVPTSVSPSATPVPGTLVTGNATWFTNLGMPYGGCGITQSALDTQNFVALNVQNTPGDYSTFFPRPITGANLSKIGIFNNGLNCGRWIRVTVSDICTGVNDGAPGQAFCRNGSWIPDAYNGATLDFIVADSCQDGNAWCRDDAYHVDLAFDSLNKFVKNGQPVGDMVPNHWNNRHMQWQFIPAPNYTGDIKIGFIKDAQVWWTPIAITHLLNGIHGVDYFENGVWVKATMNADMGQTYLIRPLTSGGTSYQIRVYDVNDQLLNNGRIYNFSFPASCGTQCGPEFTEVPYTTQ